MKKLLILGLILGSIYVILNERDVTYSQQEIEVAKVICAESVGEGKIGMYGVSNVIANRCREYNMTPYEVVTKKRQFQGYTAKNKEKLFEQGKEVALELSKNILELKDIVDGALYFKREEEKIQKWHKEMTIKIKNHIFYK